MTILKHGKRRRDPLGAHTCWNCDCQFVIQHADVLPKRDGIGDIDFPCPECQRPVTLNRLVEQAPAP